MKKAREAVQNRKATPDWEKIAARFASLRFAVQPFGIFTRQDRQNAPSSLIQRSDWKTYHL